MSYLRGIEGVVDLKGYFIDTNEGYLPNKMFFGEFPVLIMELIEGGEVSLSLQNQRTEKYLCQIFRGLVEALHGVHQKRFIHRDLKLENILLTSKDGDPKIKIIDFGSMVSLPIIENNNNNNNVDGSSSGNNKYIKKQSTRFSFSLKKSSISNLISTSQHPTTTTSTSNANISTNNNIPTLSQNDIYRGYGIVGSPGMIAPETVLNYEYSSASDIWQAGCILYSLLSGYHAFSPNRIDQIVHAKYYPMNTKQWSLISSEAKNLISLILVKNPSQRLTIPQILEHPWITNFQQVPNNDLGDNYSTRIKSLALSRKIRESFLKQDNLLLSRRERENK